MGRPVRAAGPDSASAEALFREGKRLLDAGDYAHACPKLAESYRLDPATGALLASALCYERAGKLASAWAAYTEAAARSKQEERADREQAARAKAAELEPKLSKLVITLAPGADIAGLVVTRDGTEVGEGVFGMSLPVDPGDHAIEARAPGRAPFRIVVTAAGAKEELVTVPVLTESAPENASPAAAPPPLPASSSTTESGSFWTPLRTAGVATAGLGVAGIVIGSVFGARALSLNSESDEDCDESNVCGQAGYQDRNEARQAGTVASIALASGLALTGVGITLFALGAPASGETAVTLVPVANGGGLVYRQRF